MSTTSPLRIAVVNDYDLVVAGVAAVLAAFPERVRVVERDSSMPVVSDVDVLLYDTFGAVQGEHLDVAAVRGQSGGRVVVFSWNLDPDLVREAVSRGAAGYLSKGLTALEIVESLERIHAGEVVVPDSDASEADTFGRWPGDEEGLSARESEMVALLTQGMTNQEMANHAYLSINSVKTYLRTAYRKMGVTSRSQAVLWGIDHGFLPDRSRTISPEA